MGITYMNTADVGDFSRWVSTSGTVSISNTTARTGVNSFRFNGGSGGFFGVPASASGYVKFGIYVTSPTPNDYRVYLKEGNTDHIALVFNTYSGALDVRRQNEGGPLLESGGNIAVNTWYCVEVYYVVHDSTGVVQVKLNGVQIINYSGDTRNGGNGLVDNIRVYANANYIYLDDIVCRDDMFPGVGGIYVLTPDGEGDVTSWTASSGDAHDCVNEQPPDFTDYIYTDAATLNTIHLFTIANLPRAADSIAGVGICAYGKLDASGSGVLRGKMKYSGTTSDGPSVGLSTSPLWVDYYKSTDPSGNAWTTDSVNGLQAGVETI